MKVSALMLVCLFMLVAHSACCYWPYSFLAPRIYVGPRYYKTVSLPTIQKNYQENIRKKLERDLALKLYIRSHMINHSALSD